MDPKFSILVPTRQRPDTLLATLATLIWHPGDDYEIVVAVSPGFDSRVMPPKKTAGPKPRRRILTLRFGISRTGATPPGWPARPATAR